MKKIGISFYDFWSGFDPMTNPVFGKWISKNKDKIYLGGSDIVFFSVYGSSNFNVKSKLRVLFSAENFFHFSYPTFGGAPVLKQEANKAIDSVCNFSMLHFDFGSNNLRVPNYIMDHGYDTVKIALDRTPTKKTRDILYCYRINYPFRNNIALHLMKKFKIESPCNCLRNTNEIVINKVSFMKDFKLVLAIENCIENQYTTEKLYDCFLSKCVPLYFGNPVVEEDFNKDSIVFMNELTFDQLEYEMNKLLTDEEYYNHKISINPIKNQKLFDESNFDNFMEKILQSV